VETADVVRRRHGDESRGFGFVGMPARSEGVCAVLGVHGRNLNGRTITATEVQPRDPLSGACHEHHHCRNIADWRCSPHLAGSPQRREKQSRKSENGLE